MSTFNIILLVLIFVCSFIAYSNGISAGEKNVNSETIFLRQEVERLKESINYWSSQANTNLSHNQNIINSHTANVNSALNAVVQLLQGVKSSPNANLSNEDRMKVEKMIEQAKGLR